MRANPHPIYKIIVDHAETSDLNQFELIKLSRIAGCYEQTIGTHTLQCDSCGSEHVVANTCKGLHCPFCSHIKTQNWMAARINEMVDCKYFHNVFTLPHEFNWLFRGNFSILANIFFKAVSETLNAFSGKESKKNKPGFMLFLHTWDQRLNLHFHIHAVIAGGWLDKNGIWQDATKGNSGKYLYPVKALSQVFRGKFIEFFNKEYEAGKINWTEEISRSQFLQFLPKEWNVYSKSAEGSAEKVIQYLGRYTHRTGLAKSKIEYSGETVIIKYKNRKTQQRLEEALTPQEFLKRFCQHFFRKGSQRVRYYGFLGNASKSKSLEKIREQIGSIQPSLLKVQPKCSHCNGTSFAFIRINWVAAPILGAANKGDKRIRDPRGPPSLKLESSIVRPSIVDSKKRLIQNFGPKPGDPKARHAYQRLT